LQGETVTTLGGEWTITASLDKSSAGADANAELSGETTIAVSNVRSFISFSASERIDFFD